MKLLIFHNILFAQYKSIYFEALAADLKNNNGELLVVQTAYAEKSRLNHFNIDELEKSIKYPYKLISKAPLEQVNSFKSLFYWIFTILTYKPDIVNFTGYNSFNIYITLLICRILGIKTIITSESVIKNLQPNFSLKTQLLRFIKKSITKKADYFYTFGMNANQLLFDLDIPKDKIINFGNTFDKKRLSITENRSLPTNKIPKLLFVGRLIEEKNLFETIDTLSKVHELSPIEFTLVGDGPLETQLKHYCKLNKFDFVSFKEPIKWSEIGDLYPQFDYLILFSKSETWGMVANEAQFYNLQVLCTANCGCANDLVINKFNGLVIKDLLSPLTPTEISNYITNPRDSFNFIQKNNMIFDESYAIKNFNKRLFELHGS